MIKSFKTKYILYIVLICGITIFVSCQSESYEGKPYVNAASPIEAGRCIVTVGGCNDCHTENYLQSDGDVPEADWLAGSMLGWRGGWGTTYPTNLRLSVHKYTEDEWVGILHNRKALPPMPWMNVNKMSEPDARAIYKYIKSLGKKGVEVPVMVPPDQEPKTPFLSLEPQNLGSPN